MLAVLSQIDSRANSDCGQVSLGLIRIIEPPKGEKAIYPACQFLVLMNQIQVFVTSLKMNSSGDTLVLKIHQALEISMNRKTLEAHNIYRSDHHGAGSWWREITHMQMR